MTQAVPLCAQAAPKPAAKATAKPAPKTPPPGYEEAKFVLPPASYESYQPVKKDSTAPEWKSRGVVFLPKGSVNVALHKPVTSSDDAPIIGDLTLITDGEKGAEDGRWVELMPGTQWVQIDLQKAFNIHAVLLWHYWGERQRVYRDVIIRLADNADFTKNVRTVYNNDDDNSSGLGKGTDREYYEAAQGGWIPIKAQKARFVRLYSRGNSSDPQNQYIEAEVWATPIKATKTAPKIPISRKAVSAPHTAPFLLPKPSYYRPVPRKSATGFAPVTLPPAPKKAPPGYEIARFRLPSPPYISRLSSPGTMASFPRFEPRGPVYLPKGSKNVALHKPVTASDDAPIIGDLTLITNGEKGEEEGQWVELGPSTQWVQVDLEKTFDIHGVLLWHYFGESRVYRDVVVQLSDDPDFMKNVRTVYNNDADNSSGLGPGKDREYYEAAQGGWIPIKAQKARFVRFYSRGSTSDPQNQYIEAEVWATPTK